MKTAAAYIRVSTDDQIEFSPESQRRALIDYAKKNNIILPKEFIFVDEGISGKTTAKRPQFNKMIALAKTKPKPFDVILVWKYSRFARNREDSVVYKSMLRRDLGIDVVSISEAVGNDKMSILFEAMIEAMDEYYSINLAEEVKRGMAEKAKRGGVLSVPPFGYTVKDGIYVPVPNESKIIQKVFADYVNGKGFLRIAKELNELGVTTHRGNKIENRTVEYWLNNPTYIGKTRWNAAGKTSRNYHDPNIILSDGTHKPIISEEIWNMAQARMKQQKAHYRKYYTSQRDDLSNWCVGIIRCGICGATLGNMNSFFSCSKKSRGLCPGNGGISVNKLNRIVIEVLEDIFENGNSNIEVVHTQKPILTNTPSAHDIIEQELVCAKARLERAREAYENGVYTIEEYKYSKCKIQKGIDVLSLKLKTEDKKEMENKRVRKMNETEIKRLLPILKDPEISNSDKNKLVRSVVKEIIKTGDDGKTIKIILWG